MRAFARQDKQRHALDHCVSLHELVDKLVGAGEGVSMSAAGIAD
jgi:hypothetical protein